MIKFTKDEKIVLVLLLTAFFVGSAVLYYKKTHPEFHQFIKFVEEEISDTKVNINVATKEELIKIRGVGPVLAERIIAYREKYGPFKNKEDIKNVKGVKEKTFEKIKTQVILE